MPEINSKKMKILHEILTTEELAEFVKFPKLSPHLAEELTDLTVKQVAEAANILDIPTAVLVVRIVNEI